MRSLLILLALSLMIMISGFIGCSDTVSYQRGYEAGYIQGRETCQLEINKIKADTEKLVQNAVNYGYRTGYNKGIDECTQPSVSQTELVKVLSYNLVRDTADWVTVVGELQNLSNRKLYVSITGALLNSSGEIISTSRNWNQYIEPQQKAFFKLDGFFKQPNAIDARLTVNTE